jgi:2Fe-2S ferredoxin
MNTIPVTLVTHDGVRHEIAARVGKSLMDAAVAAGIEAIVAECGGTCTCATCHVFVDAAFADRLPPPDADEQAMLEMTAEPATAASRLSCQITLEPGLAGLVVRVPAKQY